MAIGDMKGNIPKKKKIIKMKKQSEEIKSTATVNRQCSLQLKTDRRYLIPPISWREKSKKNKNGELHEKNARK